VRGWPRGLRARFAGLLHLDDPPWRIALALAIGVFIGCTPFYGLHTLLSILVATIGRLNKAATVTGTWLNLPWLTPFVYAASLEIGTQIVPDPDGTRSAWVAYVLAEPGRLSWQDVTALLHQISAALLVGTTVFGAGAAIVTYFIAFWVISWRRSRRARRDPMQGSQSRTA
jgi:uncharacterized protein (DUF2062 family)